MKVILFKILMGILHWSVWILVPVVFVGIPHLRGHISSDDILVRGAIIFIVWVLHLYLCNGCILTHLENIIAQKVIGQDTHPDYGFRTSLFYKFIQFIGSWRQRPWAFFIKKNPARRGLVYKSMILRTSCYHHQSHRHLNHRLSRHLEPALSLPKSHHYHHLICSYPCSWAS